MKKFFMLLLLAVCAGAASAQTKFAHFNSYEVLQNLPQFKTANEELQKLNAQYTEEFGRLQKEYQAKGEEYQKLSQDGTTAQAILQSKLQELLKMEESIQNFAQASQQDLQQQEANKMETINQLVMAAVKKIAEAGSYVYVLDLRMCQSLNTPVAFVNSTMSTDITAQVKKELGITQTAAPATK